MKIGILTFHFVYNYGAMLQAYALSHFITGEWKDVECELIDYRPRIIDCLYRPNWKDFWKNPKSIFKNYIKRKLSHANFHQFEDFIDTQFVLSEPIKNSLQFKKVLNKYDMVFVGSDQVWNPSITGYDQNYLLENVKDELKKFSYAASIGNEKIDNRWKYSLKLLSTFEKISVREKSTCKLMKEIIPEKNVECIADPIFLISANGWKKMEKPINNMSKYLLFYSLCNNRFLEKKAEEISRKLGLKILSIHPLYKNGLGDCRCNIGPEHFLWLIDHAEYICTDSFHATAFSAIFSKKVVVRHNTQEGDRIRNLLEALGEEKITEEIGVYDFKDINLKITEFGDDGKRFIRECIGRRY